MPFCDPAMRQMHWAAAVLGYRIKVSAAETDHLIPISNQVLCYVMVSCFVPLAFAGGEDNGQDGSFEKAKVAMIPGLHDV
jgi:hypothetical protein